MREMFDVELWVTDKRNLGNKETSEQVICARKHAF